MQACTLSRGNRILFESELAPLAADISQSDTAHAKRVTPGQQGPQMCTRDYLPYLPTLTTQSTHLVHLQETNRCTQGGEGGGGGGIKDHLFLQRTRLEATGP